MVCEMTRGARRAAIDSLVDVLEDAVVLKYLTRVYVVFGACIINREVNEHSESSRHKFRKNCASFTMTAVLYAFK